MSQQTRRNMRLIVIFDLPTRTRAQRRQYNKFRRFLIVDGYAMCQYSMYTRIIFGKDAREKHIQRLTLNAPPEGLVEALLITDTQFAERVFLVGTGSFQEKTVTSNQITLF